MAGDLLPFLAGPSQLFHRSHCAAGLGPIPSLVRACQCGMRAVSKGHGEGITYGRGSVCVGVTQPFVAEEVNPHHSWLPSFLMGVKANVENS